MSLSLLSEDLQQDQRSSSPKSDKSGVGRRGGDGALGGTLISGIGLPTRQAAVQFRADMWFRHVEGLYGLASCLLSSLPSVALRSVT